MTSSERPYAIDALQYCKWSEPVFRQMREGGLDAVHATLCYHENFREAIGCFEHWSRLFALHSDLIMPARLALDVRRARESNRTAIFFGFQTCAPIEEDLGLLEIFHALGLRFMQLSYNNQSLLATGCYEKDDSGITRMGRQAIQEMNRLGIVVDMSHSSERSTLEAIEISERPIAITHANPSVWCTSLRNKSDRVLRALSDSGGMLGFSLYPHHLKGNSACTRESFCTMVAKSVERMGIDRVGIGSDLCQGHSDEVVAWMRRGRWSKRVEFGEGFPEQPGFPPMPEWFRCNRDFPNLFEGLRNVGFSAHETAKIMGENWLQFFSSSFSPLAQASAA